MQDFFFSRNHFQRLDIQLDSILALSNEALQLYHKFKKPINSFTANSYLFIYWYDYHSIEKLSAFEQKKVELSQLNCQISRSVDFVLIRIALSRNSAERPHQ